MLSGTALGLTDDDLGSGALLADLCCAEVLEPPFVVRLIAGMVAELALAGAPPASENCIADNRSSACSEHVVASSSHALPFQLM